MACTCMWLGFRFIVVFYCHFLVGGIKFALTYIHTAPAKPLAVSTIDKGPNAVKIGWVLDQDNGGSEVTKIRVLVRAESQSWDDVSPMEVDHVKDDPTALVDGLVSEREYQIRIQAVNAIGMYVYMYVCVCLSGW